MRGRQVNSLEVGLRLARALAELGGAQALKDVAAAAGMPPAKAHRYLVSLIRAGLAEQDAKAAATDSARSRCELGLAALRSLDVLQVRRRGDRGAARRDRRDRAARDLGQQGPGGGALGGIEPPGGDQRARRLGDAARQLGHRALFRRLSAAVAHGAAARG